jgi:hypothetical protein
VRLILHAGTPKTGTTSLQLTLEQRRAWLAERGIAYPVTGGGPSPRHQWMIASLMNGDRMAFARQLEEALRPISGRIHTIVLSSEGLFNHWWDFSAAGRDALRALRTNFDVSLWVWLREPVAYTRSLYVQMLRNPRVQNVPCYGTSLSIDEMLEDRWFAKHLDYIAFIRDAESVLGSNTVVPYVYRGDTVQAFFDELQLEYTALSSRSDNASLGAVAADLLRALNRHDLPADARAQAIEHIAKIEALTGTRPMKLSPQTKEKIRSISAESVQVLSREYGLTFD